MTLRASSSVATLGTWRCNACGGALHSGLAAIVPTQDRCGCADGARSRAELCSSRQRSPKCAHARGTGWAGLVINGLIRILARPSCAALPCFTNARVQAGRAS
jgi:hypothetical protein